MCWNHHTQPVATCLLLASLSHLQHCKQGLGLLELELEALPAGLGSGDDGQDAISWPHSGDDKAAVLQLLGHHHAQLP